jgi:hypothetical protein
MTSKEKPVYGQLTSMPHQSTLKKRPARVGNPGSSNAPAWAREAMKRAEAVGVRIPDSLGSWKDDR